MKKIIEIEISENQEILENSLIMYQNRKWVVINKPVFLDALSAKVDNNKQNIRRETQIREYNHNELYNRIVVLEQENERLKEIIKNLFGYNEMNEEEIKNTLGVVEDEQE